VRVGDLLKVLDRLAPFALAEPWDNCGLLVGDEAAAVDRILVTLELTEPVLTEAIVGGYHTVVTHHPLLFSPIRRLTEHDGLQRLLRRAVENGVNVIACHTNLDSAKGGIADIVADVMGLTDRRPVQAAPAGWHKFVGFIPRDALAEVSAAVFAAGAGDIGEYAGCAFACDGEGSFTPTQRANPHVGVGGVAERVDEIRWETVVPSGRVGAVIQAYVDAHPYEEPAFDIYPVEDVRAAEGIGRVGCLGEATALAELACDLGQAFDLGDPMIAGDPEKMISTVAVVPGNGGSLMDQVAGQAEVYVTGDLSYHDGDKAAEMGLSLILLPHGELEWAAMSRWVDVLKDELSQYEIAVARTRTWSSSWRRAARSGGARPTSTEVPQGDPGSRPQAQAVPAQVGRVRLWIDGGSRGNPGPSAIGVVLQTEAGETIEEFGRCIGEGTNNVAEYGALLAGLELAASHGASEIDVFSDSELLVKQMAGAYRVKNEGLKELHRQAKEAVAAYERVAIRHVLREKNSRADALLNQALDEAAGKTRSRSSSGPGGGTKSGSLF
jgi:dinuclear metal center YbgI/SA1388 family protein